MAKTLVSPNPQVLGGNPAAIQDALKAAFDQVVADTAETVFTARAVATSIGAYTAAAGVLTANANGALAAQDGVTLAVGDLVLLPEGLTNVTAADAGPYVGASLGGAGSKVVLIRPSWWSHASTIPQGLEIMVGGEGTFYAGTTWKSFAAKGKVVGTDAPLLWPQQITQQITLVGGHLVKTNTPIRSATQTQFDVSRITANGTASTIMYAPLSITAGALGTCSVDWTAVVAAGTINAGDTSVLQVTVSNW